jgi:hypothetical protein
LILPPINHLAHGEFHPETFFHGLNYSSSLAALAQNACGFFRAEVKMLALLAWADFLNAFGGGKFLFSSKRTSMALSAMMHPPYLEYTLKLNRVSIKAKRILVKPSPLGKWFSVLCHQTIKSALESGT